MKDSMFNLDITPEEYYGDRDEMLKYIPLDVRRLLDIGCGEGNFGQLIKNNRNVEVWGIDLSERAAEKAKDKLDKVIVGNIEFDGMIIPTDYFDCIVFNDILEHLRNPWMVLDRIKIYLKRGGYVVSSIPNIRYYECMKKLLINKEWEYEESGVLDRTHLRFFTVKSIRNMFDKNGYSIIGIEGINHIKFNWKFKLLNKLLRNHLDDMRYKQFVCIAKF